MKYMKLLILTVTRHLHTLYFTFGNSTYHDYWIMFFGWPLVLLIIFCLFIYLFFIYFIFFGGGGGGGDIGVFMYVDQKNPIQGGGGGGRVKK